MIKIDTEDGFYGQGFGTGAYVDIKERMYLVLLCVRHGFNTPKTAMRLYVEPTA